MAIDPTIPLSFRPPQIAIANPLEQFGQMLSLKNLMTQGEMRGLQLKQAQLAFQGQQNLAKYFAGIDTTPPAAQALPVSPGEPAPGQYEEPNLMGPAGLPSSATPAPEAAGAPTSLPAEAAPRGFPSLGQILKLDPINGMAFAKTYHETYKAQTESQIKELEAGQKMWEARGAAAQSVLDAPDPKAAFVPAVWDLVKRGALTDTEARQLIDRGFNADELHRFASTAQDVKTQAETKLNNLKAIGEGWTNAEKALRNVNDQASYDRVFPTLGPVQQQILGSTYHPGMNVALGVPPAEQPKFFREQALSNGMRYAAALQESPQAAADLLATFTKDQQDLFRPAKTPLEAQQRSLDPEKYITTERTVRQEAFNQAANLRQGFTEASKPFTIVRDAYSRIQAAKEGPAGGVRDIGLINGYMKMVDPGQMVGERQSAQVQAASAAWDWAKQWLIRLENGESLPEETRKQVLAHVEQIYANANRDQQALEKSYTEKAQRAKLNPEDVLVQFQSTAGTPGAPTPDKTGGENTPSTPALGELVPAGTVREGPNGQMFMSKGGHRKDTKNWFPVTKNADGSWDTTRQ